MLKDKQDATTGKLTSVHSSSMLPVLTRLHLLALPKIRKFSDLTVRPLVLSIIISLQNYFQACKKLKIFSLAQVQTMRKLEKLEKAKKLLFTAIRKEKVKLFGIKILKEVRES